MIDTNALQTIKQNIGKGVTIVAATKNVPAQTINSLAQNGIKFAGENRVQELLTKYDKVCGIDWHFIGRLQTNKVKYLVDKVVMIQSVDRIKLANEIQRQCEKIDKVMDILMQINAGEESKGGVSYDKAFDLAEQIFKQTNLRLKGIMCLPPVDAEQSLYKDIKKLFDKLKSKYDQIEYLSLGMSADYQLAVQCGANMIRPGSILFGQRGG